MGITKEDGVITIDTNKTKGFFDQLAQKVTTEFNSFAQELERGKESGIEANESHLQIDFNKTGNFLDKWGQKMQDFANEFDKMTKELEINQPEKEYNATD